TRVENPLLTYRNVPWADLASMQPRAHARGEHWTIACVGHPDRRLQCSHALTRVENFRSISLYPPLHSSFNAATRSRAWRTLFSVSSSQLLAALQCSHALTRVENDNAFGVSWGVNERLQCSHALTRVENDAGLHAALDAADMLQCSHALTRVENIFT